MQDDKVRERLEGWWYPVGERELPCEPVTGLLAERLHESITSHVRSDGCDKELDALAQMGKLAFMALMREVNVQRGA